MYTTALTRSTIGNTKQHDDNGVGAGARSGGENKGFVHLLHELTLEAVLAQPHEYRRACVQSFLVDGLVPSDQDDLDYLALLMVRNAQADVLNALLGLRELVVPINHESIARGLLAAMQSGLSFSGLKLQLDATTRKEVLDVVIPLLTQAFSANASLAALILFSNDFAARGLRPLFDVLAGVKHLQLITVEERLYPDDVAIISTLLSQNKTVCALELNNLGEEQAGDAGAAGASTGMTDLFRHLGGQSLLERLVLSALPEHCQSLLGIFLGSSDSLATLTIQIDGLTATEPLVAGFRKNRSVEKLYLNLTAMEDGLLPLLAAVADCNEPLTHFTVKTCRGRADAGDSQYIGEVIGRNEALVSLVWGFSDHKGVDLARLGTALINNRRLESLYLIRQIEPDKPHDALGYSCDWVDASVIPSLLESLNKNRTLTTLFLSNSAPFVNVTTEKLAMVQQVLDRNLAWQVFACSDEYICGAVHGFFTSMGMPVDTAQVTAECLLRHTPRVAAGALALVNKATYESALAMRRDAHPALLNQRLAAMPDFDYREAGSGDDMEEHDLYCGNVADSDDAPFEDMIELLNGVVASRDDYSADDLRRMVNHPSLGGALVVMMKRSESNYLYLVKRFCQAAGKDVIRSMITGSISGFAEISTQLWRMLKKSFEPDQQHLARFVAGALDYDRIDTLPASLFVGYNIAPGPHWESGRNFTSWCVKNQVPGALMAWYDRLKSNFIGISAGEFSGEFFRGMMEKISLLQNLAIFSVKGAFLPDDALVLQRVLTAESGLLELRVDKSTGGFGFDLIMQGLMFNKGIKAVILCDPVPSRTSPMCSTLAEVLKINGIIEVFWLDLFPNDPELNDFEQLASIDQRLQIRLSLQEESSDAEEEASD